MQSVHLPSFPADAFKGKTHAGPHGDFIHEMDWIVGELMKTLDQLGMSENTIVLFASDNGPEVTTVINMRRDHQHDGAHPWRGMKRDQWEGGHRTPFIVRWPEHIQAGTVSDQLVSLTDIFATLADIVDYDLPQNAAEDSISILPVLRGESKSPPTRTWLLQQTTSGRYLSIRNGDWKYLDHRGSGGNNYRQERLRPYRLPESAPEAPAQLYNLEDDPGEKKNLYFEYPEIVKKMKAKLESFRESGRSAPKRQ
jgi:arylsulfatase A-like enzyme